MKSRGRWRRRVRTAMTRRRVSLAGTALFAVACLLALDRIGTGDVVTAATAADPWLLALAAVVYASSWPVRGRRYGDVLATIDRRCSTGVLTMAIFVSQTANLVLPARAGDGARAYLLKRDRDVSYPSGVASLAVERVFDLVAITVLAGGALGWLALVGGFDSISTSITDATGTRGRPGTALTAAAGVGGVTLCGLLLAVTVARSARRPGNAVRSRVDHPLLERVLTPVLDVLGHVRTVARSPRVLVIVGAGSLLVWLLDVVTAVLVLAALDTALATGQLVIVGTLAVSVGNLAKVLPLSQGGIGLYEAGFTALVVGLTTVSPDTALAAALVDHALKNVLTLLGGAGAMLALNVSPGTAAGTRTEPETSSKNDSVLGTPKETSDE